MSLEDEIRRLEQDIAQVESVVHLSGHILGELAKSTSPPPDLEQVHGCLRSAQDMLQHGEHHTAQPLVGQAEATLWDVRQWLAVGDLGISPFVLRRFLEAHPADRPLQQALIRYFLTKRPHAESDRDKLDYLLTAYFGPGGAGEAAPPGAHPEEFRGALEEFFTRVPRRELSAAGEMMRHELESLISRIEEFPDFDQLVEARLVERVRVLKTNLGEEFYHPQVLPTVIGFNLAFRRHFETLLHQQLDAVRQEVRRRMEEVWSLVRAIEAAYEAMALPESERVGSAISAEDSTDQEEEAHRGRALEGAEERPPIDRLMRRGEEAQKEKDSELRGLIHRMTRFLEKLPPDQKKAETVVFPLHQGTLKLARWEREAFLPSATGTAPESARTIQYALGVVGWMEEELAWYQQTRRERYLWKTHFDQLSYGVERSVKLLNAIRTHIREGALGGEAAWFGPLFQTAHRLATTLNRVLPVFEEPPAA